MADAAGELGRLADEVGEIHAHLERLYRNPELELENIILALDKLKALEPRLDAIAGAIGTDTATAVAAATAPLNQQIAGLQAAATQTEADASAEADIITGKVAAIEPLVGIAPPAPPADAAPADPAQPAA